VNNIASPIPCNPIAALVADALRDPALRAALVAILREAHPAPVDVAEPAALLTAARLAKRLSISVATVRRWENPPSVCVGDESSRRFDLDAVRAWLAQRAPKATTPAKREKDVDVSSVPGFHLNGGGR
jgi:hypothetical protein